MKKFTAENRLPVSGSTLPSLNWPHGGLMVTLRKAAVETVVSELFHETQTAVKRLKFLKKELEKFNQRINRIRATSKLKLK
ncbi:hypothetical protein [Methanolacinia paynteri]|uniref:hypothetical protein n=1 Tax=Methanolacinia paynteri TaxID=230356 RepID=UPI00064EB1D6|nr:hypothetical protein [Methanolacinia paynteri]